MCETTKNKAFEYLCKKHLIFCIIGVFFLLSAFFGSELFVHGILVPIILGSVAILYIYSYIVYRKMQS